MRTASRKPAEIVAPRHRGGVFATVAGTVRIWFAKFFPGAMATSNWTHNAKVFGGSRRARADHRPAKPNRNVGHVTLVGAGPGDAELLTLKAVRALQSADVILFDDLVSDDVLDLARRKAKRMLVGKRGGRESCNQDDINALMIKLAGQGRHVVRLKSGDPMIFGRAGEEIERLEAAGIAVTVVPGISSGMAMAAELGISLTHRDHAHSVRFVTGHSRNGKLPDDLDWKGLADKETTLIVYMGGRTAPGIAQRLIAEGLAPATPVIVATAVSRPNAQHRTTTLAGLVANAVPVHVDEPVLLGIGAVFAAAALRSVPHPLVDAAPTEVRSALQQSA